MVFFKVFFLAEIIYISFTFADDPCSPDIYSFIPRADYRGGACSYNEEDPICDVTLDTGWYRAVGLEGNLKMQETEAELFTCGTKFPIWMNDVHPSETEGETNKSVSQAFSAERSIKVKNCGEFFVYMLEPTSSCDEGYCFGVTEADPCPPIDPCSAYRELPRAEYRGSLCPYNSEKQTCDAALFTGWYRAVGRNGNLQMQETPADLFTCGTKFAVWMNGSHPAVAEGEVNVTLLQAGTDQTKNAKVKNCNDEYFVYQLEPTGACPEAYCFGVTEADSCPPFDPCDIYEHQRTEYNPVRSTSCDTDPPDKCEGSEYAMAWVAFPQSDSGFLNVSQSPPTGTKMCGFNYPMWIKETSAADADGISTNVVCTKTEHDPCVAEGTLRSKVCKWYTVYEAPAAITCGGSCRGTCSGYCLDDPMASCPVQQTTTESHSTSGSADESSPSYHDRNGSHNREYLWIIIAVVLAIIALCAVAALVLMYQSRKREQTSPKASQPYVINVSIAGENIGIVESKPENMKQCEIAKIYPREKISV